MNNSRLNALIEKGMARAARNEARRERPRRTQVVPTPDSSTPPSTEREPLAAHQPPCGGPSAVPPLLDLLAEATEHFTAEEAKARRSGRDLHDELEGWCERLATFGDDRVVLGQREPTDGELFDQWAWAFREFHGWLDRAGLIERFNGLRARDGVATANVLAWVSASAEPGRLGELSSCLQAAASRPWLLSTFRQALRRLPFSLLGTRKKPEGSAVPASGVAAALASHTNPQTPAFSGTPAPDGLVEPNRLRVRGVIYGPFRGREWRLLKCLWGKGSQPRRKPAADWQVLKFVYGDDHVKNKGALHSVKNRLNVRFLKDGCPLEVHEGERYYLELTPPA